jgi:hypothetical protein
MITGFPGLPKADAELPILEEQPWLGYFAVFANKRYSIGVLPQGTIEITPMNDKSEPVGKQLVINIDAGIEEVLPDDKTVMKQIKLETLESDDAATDKLEKTTIRGKVTGDADFELNLEQVRGVIFIGGRVLNPGTLTKNPLRFVVRAKFPNAYPNQNEQPGAPEDSKRLKEKKAESSGKAFLKKLKDDSLDLKWTDGKRVKQDFEKVVDGASPELNGPGIASAEVEISSYKGKRVVFTAAPNSAMNMRNAKPAPLHTGFTLIWTADVAKDPEGKARLAVEVR